MIYLEANEKASFRRDRIWIQAHWHDCLQVPQCFHQGPKI